MQVLEAVHINNKRDVIKIKIFPHMFYLYALINTTKDVVRYGPFY